MAKTGYGLLLLLTLAACATVPHPQTAAPTEWQQHQADVAALQQWQLQARVSVVSEGNGWSGKLLWQQRDETYQLQFNAPLGQGAFRLQGGEGGVVMELSNGQVFSAANAEALIYEQLGWRFPLHELRYWVVGVPAPGTSPRLTFHAEGSLASLAQSHWRVRFPDYVQVDDMRLPKKIYLDNTELKVRLVVDRWQVADGA